MRRSLTIEGAPDGTVPAGATDASGIVPGWPPSSVEPRAADCLEVACASKPTWRSPVRREPSGSPAGKPNASAQAVVRCAQAGCSSLHILRESGAACRWLL